MSFLRKICVVTGTRAEYGLLSGLIKKIYADETLQLQLLVTGTHLSPEYGMTYATIEEDGYIIDEKIEMLVSGDSSVSIVKSLGLGVIGFADAFDRLKPDLVVILGDRYEILGVAQSAMLMSIPLAHIHGGEITEGAFDDSIRHSLSKMSQIHFVAHEDFAKRLMQLGEDNSKIFVTGAPGIDNIKNENLLNKEQLAKKLGITLGETNFMVTYHPETLRDENEDVSVMPLLNALERYEDSTIILTHANADEGGRAINEKLRKFSEENAEHVYLFESLGIINYLSALSCFDAVIGNSSSGIIEAPTFRIPTINIGGRQKGRPMAGSVISCKNDENEIKKSIDKALTERFKSECEKVINPYGLGSASDAIYGVLKDIELSGIIKKKFIDVWE